VLEPTAGLVADETLGMPQEDGLFQELKGVPGNTKTVQYNLIHRQKLIEAREALKINPRDPKYQDILVRVSGYSAYFHDLDIRMQDEIISRTQYNLATGKAEPYDGKPLPGPKPPGLARKILLKLGLTGPIFKMGLWGMRTLLRFKREFRGSIIDFTGTYVLFTRSGSLHIPVVFTDGTMRLPKNRIEIYEADAGLELRDEAALLNYLIDYAKGTNQDLLAGVVRNEIRPHGNVNYIFKFAFLINQQLHWLRQKLPWSTTSL